MRPILALAVIALLATPLLANGKCDERDEHGKLICNKHDPAPPPPAVTVGADGKCAIASGPDKGKPAPCPKK